MGIWDWNDTTSSDMVKYSALASTVATGASSGSLAGAGMGIGSLFGPGGMAIGTGVGALLDLFGKDNAGAIRAEGARDQAKAYYGLGDYSGNGVVNAQADMQRTTALAKFYTASNAGANTSGLSRAFGMSGQQGINMQTQASDWKSKMDSAISNMETAQTNVGNTLVNQYQKEADWANKTGWERLFS